MSQNTNSEQFNEGVDLAKKTTRLAANTAKKAGKAGVNGARTIFRIIPPPWNWVVLGVLLGLILLALIVVHGMSSSSFKRTNRINAVNESNWYNEPEDADEKYDSIYEKDVAVEDTAVLAEIIQNARSKDMADIDKVAENALRKKIAQLNYGGAGIDVALSIQKAKKETADSSSWAYGNGPASSGLPDGITPDDFVTKEVVVGEAQNGENGMFHNTPGDQNKKEVCYGPGYGNSWDFVLRAKDDATKLKLAYAMKQACENDHIGYDADSRQRKTAYLEAEKVNWKISAITTDCETTCAEVVNMCMRAADIDEKYAPKEYVCTGNLWPNVKNSGLFDKIDPSSSNALPGDILIHDGHHTAMVISSPNRVNVAVGNAAAPAGGSSVADIAEKVAWPIDTPERRLAYEKGGNATDEFRKLQKKWYPNWSRGKTACCCHSARVVLAEAVNHSIGNILIDTEDWDVAERGLKESTKGTSIQVIRWDGKKSSLQRGDVCVYTTKTYGHVLVWLGNGKVANGHSGSAQFFRIEEWTPNSLGSYCYFYILRAPGAGTASTSSGLSGSKVLVLGDSISSAHGKYTEVAARSLGGNVTNKASNGRTLAYSKLSEADKNSVLYTLKNDRWYERKLSKYSCIIIAAGTNDYAYSAITARDVEKATKKIIKTIRKHNSNAPVIFVTPLRRWNNDGTERTSLANYRAAIKRAANDKDNVYVIDGDKLVKSNEYKKFAQDFTNGRLHPKISFARKQLAKRLAKELEEILASSPGTSSLSVQFTKKDSMTVLQEITPDTGSRISIDSVSGSGCAQSFAYVNGGYAVTLVAADDAPCWVQYYDKNGRALRKERRDEIRHGNGSSVSAEDTYLAGGSMEAHEDIVQEFNASENELSFKGKKKLPGAATGIAYDRQTNKYVLRKGGTISIYDKTLSNNEKTIVENMHGTHYQDIGAGYGYILACHTEQGCKGFEGAGTGENYVDIYNETTGDYCGSYFINYGELESVDVVDGEIVLLMHIYLSSDNYIHRTGIYLDNAGSSMAGSGYITKLDMDILAAYNLSISNTSMYLNRIDERENATWLDSKGYTDVRGNPVKVYWIGKNRGMINYESDLRSKVDKLFKGNAVETETSDTISITKPDATKWNLLLVNSSNKIPDGYRPDLKNIDSKYTTYRGAKIDKRVYKSLIKMLDDCRKAGHDPLVCSAYRTKEEQKKLYDAASNKKDTALPGTSEHECGLAVDIVDSSYQQLDDKQADTAAQKWLMDNCQKYGFILRYPKDKQDVTGIIWEPWHYRYVGKTAAKEIMKYGCALEEYLSGSIPVNNNENAPGSNHFYKIVIGTSPETVDGKKILPMTIKELEVDDLMEPFFGLDPDEVYVNTTGLREISKKKADKEDAKSRKGTATNFEAALTLSDNTGKMLFGQLHMIQDPDYMNPGAAAGIPGGSAQVTTDMQRRILQVISANWPEGRNPWDNGYQGLCAAWVFDIYEASGLCANRLECAEEHRLAYAKTTGDIPPGAMIYSNPSVYRSSVTCDVCGRNAGHVGIYLGNNKIVGSQPTYILTLDEWTSIYGYGGWSFAGNKYP